MKSPLRVCLCAAAAQLLLLLADADAIVHQRRHQIRILFAICIRIFGLFDVFDVFVSANTPQK